MIWLRVAAALLSILPAASTTVKVRVLDASGAPFPKVLVIIKSLEGGGEVIRDLTDVNGRIRAIDVGSGLYRIIATCPYGLCGTAVKEFVGGRSGEEILITVPPRPSDLSGELLGAPSLRVILKLPNGSPASGIPLLVRDEKAKREKWYVADERGAAIIELLADPIVLVAVHNEIVSSLQVHAGCLRGADGFKCTGIDLSQGLTWQLQ